MEHAIKFLLLFIFIYILFYFMLVFKNKKRTPNEAPTEISYLIKRYNLNLSNIFYKKLLNAVAFINAFIFTLAVSATEGIDNYIIRIGIALLILIPLILLMYHFLGIYFKKKGMEKDV